SLCDQQAIEQRGYLAFLTRRVGARHVDAITVGRSRRSTNEVIVFVGNDQEQRVVLGDPVSRQASEELAKCDVILLELCDITCLARPESGWAAAIIMHVSDV